MTNQRRGQCGPSSHSAGVRTDRILDHDTRAATGRIEQREGGISYRSQEKLCLMLSQETDYSYTRRDLRGHTSYCLEKTFSITKV